jgi:hypothetical protein
MISVVRRSALEAYHTRRWRLTPHAGAPASLEAA